MRRAAYRLGKAQRQGIAVAVLVLALVLRLPSIVPIMADPSRDFAAAFGEHALCLAPAAGDPATGPSGEAPAGPGGHADHDAAKCCQSHAAGAIVLPGVGSAAPILITAPAACVLAPDAAPPARSIGHAWARAPPFAAG